MSAPRKTAAIVQPPAAQAFPGQLRLTAAYWLERRRRIQAEKATKEALSNALATVTTLSDPAPLYSTGSRGAVRPGDLAFQVLKFFNQRVPPNGCANVGIVAQYLRVLYPDIPEAKAREAVKELWNFGYIETKISGPGEWNGSYAITMAGMDCVEKFAT